MLRFIRDQLGITRDDLALYLGLSPNMVKSIEDDRRQIPKYCEEAVAAMLNAIREGKARGLAGNPTPASSQQIRLMKRRHRIFSLRLRKYTGQLERMQSAYALASANRSRNSGPGNSQPQKHGARAGSIPSFSFQDHKVTVSSRVIHFSYRLFVF